MRSTLAGVAIRAEDYDTASGPLRILGKGNRQRTVYATNGGTAYLAAWLAIRGDTPGPILSPVSKGGSIRSGEPMRAQALMMPLKRRTRQATIGYCSPHDLRHRFISTALDNGADLAMVQALAGHANPATTARYDRRPAPPVGPGRVERARGAGMGSRLPGACQGSSSLSAGPSAAERRATENASEAAETGRWRRRPSRCAGSYRRRCAVTLAVSVYDVRMKTGWFGLDSI